MMERDRLNEYEEVAALDAIKMILANMEEDRDDYMAELLNRHVRFVTENDHFFVGVLVGFAYHLLDQNGMLDLIQDAGLDEDDAATMVLKSFEAFNLAMQVLNE